MILFSKRTKLEPLNEKDIPEVISMYKEPDAFKYVKLFQGKSDDFYINLLKNKIRTNPNEIEFWIVRKKENNEFIGTVNLNKFSNTTMTQIGCHLKRKFWNYGYASELLNSILEYGIKVKKLREIFGIFENDNIASKKIFEKMEFTHHTNLTILNTTINIYKYCSQISNKN